MRRHRQSLWTNTLFSFAVPVSAGVVCIFLCSVFFSAITFFVLKSVQFQNIFTMVSLAAGGTVSGQICGKYRRKRGLIDGIICGAALYFLIFTAGIIMSETADIKKLLLLIIAGAVGGVSGVNSKRPKSLM